MSLPLECDILDEADATILEAMGEGLPIISASADGTIAVRIVRTTGRQVSSYRLETALSSREKTSLIIRDSNLAERLGAGSRLLVRTEFSIEAFATGITRVYQEILAERRSAA